MSSRDDEPNTSPLLEGIAVTVPPKTTHFERLNGMFPPAFNKLREVLYEEHHDIWLVVGGMMIHNHDFFIHSMNNILETLVTPSMGIEAACEHWIKALAKRPKTYRRN